MSGKPAKDESGGGAIYHGALPHELDQGLAGRARLGLIVLASDHTIEHEYHQVLSRLDGVTVYGSRVLNDPSITPETLAAMETRIPAACEMILPGVPLDVVAYGCTSASMVIGEDKIFTRIREARPGVACTTPVTAARAAFQTLGLRRFALLTPYVEEINVWMRNFFQSQGFEVPVMGSFNEGNDNDAARIAPASIRDAALTLGQSPNVDGVFVSCTSLRLVGIVEELEQALGKPVSSSNHAMIWHSLRLAGVSEPIEGLGRLMRLGLPN